MMSVQWDDLIKLASFLENEVGPAVLAIRDSESLDIEAKTAFWDIKTRGDTTSESMVVGYLRKHFPNSAIWGEEGATESGVDNDKWIVDPIDGTTMYASGSRFFGISVGCVRDGVPYAGVIHYPALEKTLIAMTGHGVFLNGKRITLPPFFGEPSQTVIAAGLTNGHEHAYLSLRERFPIINGIACVVVEALLILDDASKAYIHTGATPFDIAAATVVVREAGGVVIPADDAGVLDFSREKIPVVFACTRELAEEIREVVNLKKVP